MSRTALAGLILAVFTVLVTLPAAAQDGATPVTDNPMAVFEPYFGEWHVDATWAWGETLDARQVFEPMFDGKHVRVQTFVNTPDGEYLRYEGTYSYRADTGEYVYSSLAFDGTSDTGTFAMTGEGMKLVREVPGPDGATAELHQTITLPADDTYTWRVWTVDAEGAEQLLMDDAEWIRVTD